MAGRCDCQRPCNCCTSPTDSIDVAGTGSGGLCWAPSVRYSLEAGNRARAGSDGAVFADTCVVLPDGNTADHNEDGCAIIPAPCILDYNNDPIVPDEGGCIQLPTNGAPPDFACGLKTAPITGELMVATSGTIPASDLTGAALGGASTDYGETICDESGEVRGLPDHTAITVGAGEEVLADGLLAVPATFTSPSGAAVSLTNPSPSRRMLVERAVYGTVDLITPPVGAARVWLQENVNGGGWADVRSLRWPEPQGGTESIRFEGELSSFRTSTINPGDALTLELRVKISKVGAGADPPVAVTATVSCRLVGHTI